MSWNLIGMNQASVYYRNKIIHSIYVSLLKPFFFRHDPEFIHDQMTKVGVWLGRLPFGKSITKSFFDYKNSSLEQKFMGIEFKNPVGLSAGFDKNAELTDILPSIGFGFAEVGSVTGKPCMGNPKPRLWRLPKSKSLAVYYGLKNNGCENIAKKLQNKKSSIPIGVSVAATNCRENISIQKSVADFAKSFRTMEPLASYITVNISCPNTETGQPFIKPHNFDYLFDILDEIPTSKPIFIKLSPDLSETELDQILDLARSHRIHGIICTNLTKKRINPKILDSNVPALGGLSGKVVEELSDKLLSYVYKREGERFVLIGSGGVFSAEDAYRKIRLGATMVQMITGMIYEGPQVISEINRGLAKFLMRDGFRNISEAVGADNKI
jgi:dihydroorotate dehydrogenase